MRDFPWVRDDAAVHVGWEMRAGAALVRTVRAPILGGSAPPAVTARSRVRRGRPRAVPGLEARHLSYVQALVRHPPDRGLLHPHRAEPLGHPVVSTTMIYTHVLN